MLQVINHNTLRVVKKILVLCGIQTSRLASILLSIIPINCRTIIVKMYCSLTIRCITNHELNENMFSTIVIIDKTFITSVILNYFRIKHFKKTMVFELTINENSLKSAQIKIKSIPLSCLINCLISTFLLSWRFFILKANLCLIIRKEL